MNILRKKQNRFNIKKALKLQSAFAALTAIILYTILSTLCFKPPASTLADISTSFSFMSTDRNDPVQSSIEDLILDAKESVTLIIYSLSDYKIIKALKSASSKGKQITVLYDPTETGEGAFSLGPTIRCIPCKAKGLMHNKLVVIDHSYVWMGSANLSLKSLTSHGNLVMTIDCKQLATRIEDLADHLIRKKPYITPPLELISKEQKTTVFFHPYHGQQSLRFLIDRINAATNRIFVAMFTFTNKDLATALAKAKQRGVDVRVVFDKDSCKRTSKKIFTFLRSQHIACGFRKKTGLLHYKTALIDNSLITGSCNWTKAAFSDNCETIVFIKPLNKNQKVWIEQWWRTVESISTLPNTNPN